MKARINKTLDFTREYIDQMIANGGGFSDIVAELKTAPQYVEKRIEQLFEHESKTKLAELYANDQVKAHKDEAVSKLRKKVKKSRLPIDLAEIDERVEELAPKSVSRMSTIDLDIKTQLDSQPDASSEEQSDFLDFMADNFYEGLEYALGQLEADEAVGEKYEEADTSASRAALKKLDIAINAAEKSVSEAQSKLNAAEVARTEAEERVERATEKLRRAKQDAGHAASALDAAKSRLHNDKSKLEDLRKERARMQQEIDSIELPTFSIVPSGEYIVLKAINYDTRKMDNLEAALKWSRRIGEKFSSLGLSDSEFAVLGRLFGILSKLKGKFKLNIDPSCTNAITVYEEFKTCFT